MHPTTKQLPIKLVAVLLVLFALALAVAPPGSADDRGYQSPSPIAQMQTFTQVVAKPFGTKIQVSFHLGYAAVPTVAATNSWGSGNSVTGTGVAKNDWTIVVDGL